MKEWWLRLKKRQNGLKGSRLAITGKASIDKAARCIRRGGVVAFPTETYYGLAVDPFNGEAVEKLFRLKQRPPDRPVLLLLENLEQLYLLVSDFPEQYQPLIERYWPGPLTLVFPALQSMEKKITAGTGSVGVRISPHPIASQLVAAVGHPITATSANLSGQPPARNVGEIAAMFENAIDLVLDGGEAGTTLCSTVVGIKDSKIKVLRSGQVDVDHELRKNTRCFTGRRER